ncbi:MAG TPA: MerR family transcriptional regulator [Hyphomicrobiaceae bacterium]|nr:MerR family transcriptional regulator [Hyphomicrobiaceae bacterium]
MSKAAEAFRNIGEVSAELGVKKHVLRFWEMKFPQLKPMKRGGGRRLYRPGDVELLKGIRDLLQNAGYTIKGVQRLLREQGVEHVKAAGASCATGATRAPPLRRPPTPVAGKGVPVLFSALEVAALRSIASELDACKSLLAGAREGVPDLQGERVG